MDLIGGVLAETPTECRIILLLSMYDKINSSVSQICGLSCTSSSATIKAKPNTSSIYVTEKDTSGFVRLKRAFVPKPKDRTLVVCVLL